MIFVVETKNQSRNMINNPHIYEDVTNSVKNMPACANISDRYSTVCGTDDLNHGMLKEAVMVRLYVSAQTLQEA